MKELNTVNIDDQTFFTAMGGIKDPVFLSVYHVPANVATPERIRYIKVLAQIFHTNLKHFNLKKGRLVDLDVRRPIYEFEFNSAIKAALFVRKHLQHFLAFEQIELVEIDGKETLATVRGYGMDLHRLRSFIAWTEYVIAGEISGYFVNDCSVEKVNGGFIMNAPEITHDEFIACLKGEKTLNQPEKRKIEDKNCEIDGVTMPIDQSIDYMRRKTMLEQMTTSVAN